MSQNRNEHSHAAQLESGQRLDPWESYANGWYRSNGQLACTVCLRLLAFGALTYVTETKGRVLCERCKEAAGEVGRLKAAADAVGELVGAVVAMSRSMERIARSFEYYVKHLKATDGQQEQVRRVKRGE